MQRAQLSGRETTAAYSVFENNIAKPTYTVFLIQKKKNVRYFHFNNMYTCDKILCTVLYCYFYIRFSHLVQINILQAQELFNC